MMDLLKLVLFALTAGVLYPLVKSYVPQFAPVLAVAVSAGVIALLFSAGSGVVQWLGETGQTVGGDAFLCLAKAAGVLLCADWCRDLCRDNGLSAVAGCIDLAGRCLALAAAFPLFQTVYSTILGLAA